MTEPAPTPPKRRGRPPGPGKPLAEKMVDAADRQLLLWLREGVVTFSGQFDEAGQPVMVKKQLSAAHMQCVLKRLNQIGAAHRKYDKHRTAGDLLAEARRRFNGPRAASLRISGGAQGGMSS